jgi:hypothetical protein
MNDRLNPSAAAFVFDAGINEIHFAANVNELLSDSGSALCALADILDAVDEERFKGDYPHAGLGYLLKIIGGETLQHADQVRELLATAYAASVSTKRSPA